jgi:Fe-S oxidoreductase
LTYTTVVFVVVLLIALAFFGWAFARRVQYVMIGRPEPRFDRPLTRTLGFLGLVFGQKKLFKERVGVIHFFIFWGFIIIAFGTLQIIAEGIHPGFAFPWAQSYAFLFIKDLLSLIVLIGLIVLAYIRYVVRKTRLEPSAEAGVILGLIFFLILSEFFYSGVSYALDPTPASEGAFVATAIAGWFAGASTAGLEAARTVLWWVHVVLLLAFLVYIPISKHMHLIMCPVNEWLRNLKPRGGQIYPVDFESEDVEEFGVGKVQGFTKKQLLDLYACAECGRCQDNCPATQSGKALNPKLLMTKLKEHLDESGSAMRKAEKAAKVAAEAPQAADGSAAGAKPAANTATAKNGTTEGPEKALIGDVISTEEIWACTTCYSCQEQCPVMNEHINKIVDMRRHLVLMESEFPHEATLVFRNMEVNGNPLGESALIRGDHLRKLGVPTIGENPDAEILYWPGCSGALEARNQKVSTAFVRLAESAGVSLATLGNEEKCCGEAARRLGNEYLYQTLALGNVEVLNGYGVKKIVTQCPHCFNTLKNEYPQLGGDFEVLHHTQFLSELIGAGRLELGTQEPKRITYHDACYLGRYNGIYELPRQLLTTAGLDLVEMPRKKAKAFCCGGGGGRMWLEENEGERINNVRTDEVLSVAPDIAAVACPYCLTMLKDGVDARGASDRVQVMDIAEILQATVPSSTIP